MVNELIKRIDEDVADILNTGFEYSATRTVPSSEKSGLTFERGEVKKGQTISTCVLFVDIRDSVTMSQQYGVKIMGKIYTAFTKAVIKAAHHHGGSVRNIIGDRVMIVFPIENCFKNAIDCAVSINHVSRNIMTKHFNNVNFKCGIGIDYGELKVIKVGLGKQGVERTENKGLVWVGNPANIASRLTDKANKTITEDYYLVKWHAYNYFYITGMNSLSMYPNSTKPQNNSLYSNNETIKEMTPADFASRVCTDNNGKLYLTGGKLISFEKKTREIEFQPILITNEVYQGFRRDCPNRYSIKNNLWTEVKQHIKNVQSKVYSGDFFWKIN